MRFIADHDFHIHTGLSLCSGDENQNPETILAFAKSHGLTKVCITNHFWDGDVPGASTFYEKQGFDRLKRVLPLPRDPEVKMLFGCECDLDRNMRLGITRERFDDFDFAVISTTHFHMRGFTISEEDASSLSRRAVKYVDRLDAVLDMDLPFSKVGLAHLTSHLIANSTWEEHMKVLDMIPDSEFLRIFSRATKLGAGIELNFKVNNYDSCDVERVLRPYRIARATGAKFYLGSDTHHSVDMEDRIIENFEKIIDLLDLKECNKFELAR